jgi:hypothetical protein
MGLGLDTRDGMLNLEMGVRSLDPPGGFTFPRHLAVR